MRGFVAAIVTLSVLAVAVLLNGICIGHTADSVISLLDSTPKHPSDEGALDRCLQISQEWQSFSRFLRYAVDRDVLEAVEGSIADLLSHCRTRDLPSYTADIARLKNLLYHLKETELPFRKK